MAVKYPYVKFLKIISTDASATYDDVALPTLLAYQNGQLVASLIRITEEIGHTFDQDDVQKLLQRFVVIDIALSHSFRHGVLPVRVSRERALQGVRGLS